MSIVGIKTLKDFTSIIFCKVFSIRTIGVRLSHYWCLPIARRVLSSNIKLISNIFTLKLPQQGLEKSLHTFLILYLKTIRK